MLAVVQKQLHSTSGFYVSAVTSLGANEDEDEPARDLKSQF